MLEEFNEGAALIAGLAAFAWMFRACTSGRLQDRAHDYPGRAFSLTVAVSIGAVLVGGMFPP